MILKPGIRTILLGLAIFSFPAHAQNQQAERWPTKPITFVAPYSGGGSVDVLARLMGNEMSKTLGQPFLILNKPGAGGTIGASFVAHAPSDGYTILLCTLPDRSEEHTSELHST